MERLSQASLLQWTTGWGSPRKLQGARIGRPHLSEASIEHPVSQVDQRPAEEAGVLRPATPEARAARLGGETLTGHVTAPRARSPRQMSSGNNTECGLPGCLAAVAASCSPGSLPTMRAHSVTCNLSPWPHLATSSHVLSILGTLGSQPGEKGLLTASDN